MQAVSALVWHPWVFFLALLDRSYSWDLEIHFQKFKSKISKEPGEQKQMKRSAEKILEPEKISNRGVLGSRNSERMLFGWIGNLERRRKHLEKQSTVEIVTICGQRWNLTCRWETRSVKFTLRCQTPYHITGEISHLKTCHRPHP